MNTDKLLGMLLEAIDYSFLQVDGSYDKTLTYPVIDKIQYIKTCKNMEVKDINLDKEATEFVQTKEFIESKESPVLLIAKHFFELGLKMKGE